MRLRTRTCRQDNTRYRALLGNALVHASPARRAAAGRPARTRHRRKSPEQKDRAGTSAHSAHPRKYRTGPRSIQQRDRRSTLHACVTSAAVFLAPLTHARAMCAARRAASFCYNPGAMALLEIQDVSRRFGDFTAVDRVSIAIEAGEFFTLLGPSGWGKTTLLRMIAGFDLPDGGRILLTGEDLADRPPEQRPVRTVFQSYALFPHMTVEGNIAFPLQMAKTPAAEIPGKVEEALADVRLL